MQDKHIYREQKTVKTDPAENEVKKTVLITGIGNQQRQGRNSKTIGKDAVDISLQAIHGNFF